jgi:probable phosphoglycerate mutase
MKLILARHGNTFATGDSVVWTGSSNDIPLVDAGKEQARLLASELKERSLLPSLVLAGPLVRTREYADIVVSTLGLEVKPIIDPRLMEIDYGDWTGLTNDEVAAQFSAEEQAAWNERSEWPSEANWGGSKEGIIAEVRSLASELEANCDNEATVLIVSSNGRIRYFLELIKGAFTEHVAASNFKVKTGSYCLLELFGGSWNVLDWNKKPTTN